MQQTIARVWIRAREETVVYESYLSERTVVCVCVW